MINVITLIMSVIDNEIRKNERNAIGACCKSFKLFRNLDLTLQHKLIFDLESSILDASIDSARERNIPVYWDSNEFIDQYSSIGYNVKINIDINSSVNRNKKDNFIRHYLILNLYNTVITKYLSKLYLKYNKSNKSNSINLFNIPMSIFNYILSYIPTLNINLVGYMNSLELNPYINQIYIDALELRCKQIVKIKYSEMYTCQQCGNKKTQMREIQTRSSDEGGTLFINCIICGSTWRQY